MDQSVTRALIVGAGSIGLRHGEVLSELGCEIAFVSGRTDIPNLRFTRLELALDDFEPEYVVVANETVRHASTLVQLAAAGFPRTVLVEKPLSTPLSVIESSRFSVFGVGYNLRFHPLVLALVAAVAGRSVLTAEVYAGQHLSTWRRGRPVAEQYSAIAERGGGVLRDLSHELDYLDLLLGHCEGVFARGGRLGEVTVDSDDAWGLVAQYERSAIVTVQLNYLDTQTRRRVIVNTGDSTIEADFVSSTLRVDGESVQFDTLRNASYTAMHSAMLTDSGRGVTTAREAARTDSLIATIERSALEQRWIEP
jgi:predicted dehydrogenase